MLGEKIISERKKCKLSQEDLAEKLGITRQTISNWELNETSPDLKQASKLCDIFNLSLDELTGKENAILTKLDKTESNSKLIIKLVKTVGITLGTLIFILLCIVSIYIYSTNYYTAEPTATGEGRFCYYNGKISDYTVMKNNSDGSLSYDVGDINIINDLDLYNIKTGEPKEILEKIVKYIKDNGGTCLEDR
ncbi:dNA-binding helix-turn-helix protein [Clostridium sp. CAG:533]|jgi:transcriptional regulator with XRE-family HTH domain|nr:dNA-binding helix-turn-helix protein [Clostridium sp. CAG:533]